MTTGKLDTLFVGSDGTLQECTLRARETRRRPRARDTWSGSTPIWPTSRSELIVVDAQRMQELARVILPIRISEQVHGAWAPYEDLPFDS